MGMRDRPIRNRRSGGMKKEYRAPELTCYGWMGHHTFQTPGVGTKSSDTSFEPDKFGEFSHPATASS